MQYQRSQRHYEDIRLGETFTSSGRTITDADIMGYAGISGDFSRLHVDDEYMKSTPFGGRIAHGLLTIAASSGLTGPYFNDINLIAHLESAFRFENAVRPGDTIHVVVTALEMRETRNPQRGVIKFGRQIFNQREQRTSDGHTTVLVQRRPPNSAV